MAPQTAHGTLWSDPHRPGGSRCPTHHTAPSQRAPDDRIGEGGGAGDHARLDRALLRRGLVQNRDVQSCAARAEAADGAQPQCQTRWCRSHQPCHDEEAGGKNCQERELDGKEVELGCKGRALWAVEAKEAHLRRLYQGGARLDR